MVKSVHQWLLVALLLLTGASIHAQIGGRRAFEFLNLPADARMAALGGVNASLLADDVNLMLTNPALLDSTHHQQLSVGFAGIYAGIQQQTVAYGRTVKDAGHWGASLQYLNYGSFDSYDATGVFLGEFDAADYAVGLTHSRQAGSFRIGATLRYVHSRIGTFNANAFLVDVGGLFVHPKKELRIGLTVKHVGFLFSDYTETNEAQLPFDVRLGLTFKPKHMPVRFTFTAANLYEDRIALFDGTNDFTGQLEEASTAEQVFRHLSLGTEFVFSKNFQLRAGYNHRIRREMRLLQASGGAGFSFGAFLRIKAFQLAWSKSFYHTAGGTTFVTVNTDLNRVFRRKKRNTIES